MGLATAEILAVLLKILLDMVEENKKKKKLDMVKKKLAFAKNKI